MDRPWARNSTDWHRLLEIFAVTDTLILDEDRIREVHCKFCSSLHDVQLQHAVICCILDLNLRNCLLINSLKSSVMLARRLRVMEPIRGNQPQLEAA